MSRHWRVLFVCTGNICRSPTAEGVLRARALARGVTMTVDSAGLEAFHVGNAPDARAQAVASARGYRLADQRARALQAADFANYDHVLVMDRGHLRLIERRFGKQPNMALFLERFAPKQNGPREVPDPYLGDVLGFERVLDLIEAGVGALLDQWERENNTPPDFRGT